MTTIPVPRGRELAVFLSPLSSGSRCMCFGCDRLVCMCVNRFGEAFVELPPPPSVFRNRVVYEGTLLGLLRMLREGFLSPRLLGDASPLCDEYASPPEPLPRYDPLPHSIIRLGVVFSGRTVHRPPGPGVTAPCERSLSLDTGTVKDYPAIGARVYVPRGFYGPVYARLVTRDTQASLVFFDVLDAGPRATYAPREPRDWLGDDEAAFLLGALRPGYFPVLVSSGDRVYLASYTALATPVSRIPCPGCSAPPGTYCIDPGVAASLVAAFAVCDQPPPVISVEGGDVYAAGVPIGERCEPQTWAREHAATITPGQRPH